MFVKRFNLVLVARNKEKLDTISQKNNSIQSANDLSRFDEIEI